YERGSAQAAPSPGFRVSEIDAMDLRVPTNLLRCALCEYAALVHDRDPARDGEDHVHVMLRKENREPSVGRDARHESHQGMTLVRSYAGRRLLQSEHPRLACQRNPQLGPPLIAVRKNPARLSRLLPQSDAIEQRKSAVPVQSGGVGEQVVVPAVVREQRRLDVLDHGQAPEDAGDLERAPRATGADLVGRQPADLFTTERDSAGLVAQVAGDQVEQRRLSGAVWADDRAKITIRDRKVHAVHGAHTTEVLP